MSVPDSDGEADYSPVVSALRILGALTDEETMSKAGRPKKRAAERSSEILATPLTPEALERVRALAEERRVTMAELVRHALRQTYLVTL